MREAGAEGEVLTDEGTPLGTALTSLLESGPLPIEVGLEIIAFMADILTIAEEDEAMHGNINPGDVYIDVSGAVSLAGYGVQRARGRAPEGKPQFLATDVYGLGIVLHAILSREPMGVVPRDRDGHDDAIVDRLLAIDWSGCTTLLDGTLSFTFFARCWLLIPTNDRLHWMWPTFSRKWLPTERTRH